MEYLYTNLPRYITVTPRSAFADSVVQSGSVLLFSEDGTTLTAKLPDGSFITVGGSGGTDVSDTTATAADVLAGKDFHLANGVKATGTIQTVTASQSGNVVTVPAGYIAAAQTFTVGTAKAAATYTPTTSDQTITAGQYLTGDQTIKGDANLLAANIVQGVTIFGVTGTASGGGGGSTDFYKCASVNTANNTWTGYKAVLSGGSYTFEATVTSGLTYGAGFTPAVGNVYSEDTRIQAAKLYTGWEAPAGYVFYAPLDDDTATAAETGQSFTVTGSPVSTVYLGIPCLQFSGSDVIEAANTNIPYSDSPLSISMWLNIASNPAQDSGILAIGSDSEYGAGLMVVYNSTGIGLSGHGPGYGWNTTAPVTFAGQWLHVVVVFGQGSGGSRPASVWIGGTETSGSFAYNASAYESYTPRFFLGSYWGNASYIPNFTGRMAAVRIYPRALTAAEIATLAAEFTPSAQ